MVSKVNGKTYALFINLFLQYFGGRELRTEDKGQGPKVEQHKHPFRK